MGEFTKYTVWLRDTKPKFPMSPFTIYFRESGWDYELNSWVRSKHDAIELALDKYPSRFGAYRLAYLPVPYSERPDHKSFIDACDYQLNQSLSYKNLSSNKEGYISVVIPTPQHLLDANTNTQRILTINIEDNTTDARIAAFEHIQLMADEFIRQTKQHGDVCSEIYERKAPGLDEMKTVQPPVVEDSNLNFLDASWIVNTETECPELLDNGWLERIKETKFKIYLHWDSSHHRIVFEDGSPLIDTADKVELAYYLLVLQHPEGVVHKKITDPEEIASLEKEFISIYQILKGLPNADVIAMQNKFKSLMGKTPEGKLVGSTTLNQAIAHISASIKKHCSVIRSYKDAEQIARMYAIEKGTYQIRADRNCFDLPKEVFNKKKYRIRLAEFEED